MYPGGPPGHHSTHTVAQPPRPIIQSHVPSPTQQPSAQTHIMSQQAPPYRPPVQAGLQPTHALPTTQQQGTTFFTSSKPQLLSYPHAGQPPPIHVDEKKPVEDGRVTHFRTALFSYLQEIRYNLDKYQTQVNNITQAMSRMASTISQATPVSPSQPPPPRAIDLYEDNQVWPILQKCDTIQLVQLSVMCGLHTHPYVTIDLRQQRKIVKHVLRIVRRDGRKLPATYAHLPTIRKMEHDQYATASLQQQQTLNQQRNPQLAIQLRDIRTMTLMDLLGLCSYETMSLDYSEYLIPRQIARRDLARGVAAGEVDEDELEPIEQVKLDVAAINTHIHNNVYELRLSHKHVQQDVTYLQHQQQLQQRHMEGLTKRVDKLDQQVGQLSTTMSSVSQQIQRVDTSLGVITAILQAMYKTNPLPNTTSNSTIPEPSLASLLSSLSTASTCAPSSSLDSRINTLSSTLETHQTLSSSLHTKTSQLQEKLVHTTQSLSSVLDTNDYIRTQQMIQQDDIGIPDNNAIVEDGQEEGIHNHHHQRRDSSSGQHSMDIACAVHLEFNQSPSSAYTDRGTNLSEQQREALLDDLGLDVMAGISYTCSAASRLYTFLQNHVQATAAELALDTLYRYQQLSGDGSSWKCSVHFRNLPVIEAIGATKSDAKEIASRNALNVLVQNPHYTQYFMISIPSYNNPNPTSDLINLLATHSRYKEKVIYEFDETKPNLIGCSISYHDRHISWGMATTRAKAKQYASSYALYLLEQAKQLHIATTKAATITDSQQSQQQQQQPPALPARPSIPPRASPTPSNRTISTNPFSSSPANPFAPSSHASSSPSPAVAPAPTKVSLMGRMFGKSVEKKDNSGVNK